MNSNGYGRNMRNNRPDRDQNRRLFQYQIKTKINKRTDAKLLAAVQGIPNVHRGELLYLMDLVKITEGGFISNLGCFEGGSAGVLAYALEHYDLSGHVFTTDPYGTIKSYMKGDFSKAKKRFEKIGVTNNVTQCTGLSTEWALKIDHKFNLVFIDADHSYDSCKADFEAWFPKLNKGGLIAFHDSHLNSVHDVIEEKKKELNLIEIPGWDSIRTLGVSS